MELTDLDRLHLTDPALENALTEAARAVAEVTLSTDYLTNGRAFKHVDHPLSAGTAALEAAVGPVPWRVQDIAWRFLVEQHLLPALDVEVTLSEGSYNSAFASYVNGLTENHAAIRWHEVTVGAAEIAAAYRAAVALVLSGSSHPPQLVVPERPSTLKVGLAGLVGRLVDVTFVGGNPDGAVHGTVVAHVDAALVMALEECITVIPVAAISSVTTWQLTADEVEATLDV